MLAVISPSKTQDFSSSNVDVFTKMRQIEQSQILIDLLKTKTQGEIASLMSISDKLSKLNFDRFQTFSTPFTLTNAKQALLAFKGDVYNGIDAPNLSSQDLDFAQSCVRMLSGLYGVIRPLDLIQPYRLKWALDLKTIKAKICTNFGAIKSPKYLMKTSQALLSTWLRMNILKALIKNH